MRTKLTSGARDALVVFAGQQRPRGENEPPRPD
jgi:hypothetical protein